MPVKFGVVHKLRQGLTRGKGHGFCDVVVDNRVVVLVVLVAL